MRDLPGHPGMMIFLAVAIGLMVYVAIHDVMARTIPNRATLALLLCGIVIRVLAGGLLPGSEIALATFGILLVGWTFGFIGGGDAKFWPVASLSCPPALNPQVNFLIGVALIGGALSLLYLMLYHASHHGLLWPPPRLPPRPRDETLFRRVRRAELHRIARRPRVPYAVAISGAAIATILLAPKLMGGV